MTRIKMLLAKTFPFMERDEKVGFVIERSRQSRLQLQEALANMPDDPELYEQWRDALKSTFGGDACEPVR
jgi:hypothetical protein